MRSGRVHSAIMSDMVAVCLELTDREHPPPPAAAALEGKLAACVTPLRKQYLPQQADNPLFGHGEFTVSAANSTGSISQMLDEIEALAAAAAQGPSPSASASQQDVHGNEQAQASSSSSEQEVAISASSSSEEAQALVSPLSSTENQSTNILHDSKNVQENTNLLRKCGEAPQEQRHPDAWQRDYQHITTDWSVRMMDKIWDSCFYYFIKNEENVECIAKHLSAIIRDYKVWQVANGIKWLVRGWALESTAKLLKYIFYDWFPDLSGLLVRLITEDWSGRPSKSLLVAFILANEPAEITAMFLKVLTETWDKSDVTELISYLDTVLEWPDDYFKDFTQEYIRILKEEQDENGGDLDSAPEDMLQHLAALYKANLSIMNWKLAMADMKLDLAETSLLKMGERLSCVECQLQIPCSVHDVVGHGASGVSKSDGELARIPRRFSFLESSASELASSSSKQPSSVDIEVKDTGRSRSYNDALAASTSTPVFSEFRIPEILYRHASIVHSDSERSFRDSENNTSSQQIPRQRQTSRELLKQSSLQKSDSFAKEA